MVTPFLRTELLGFIAAARHLEHRSISFTTNAEDFFRPTPELRLDWRSLRTLALTSDILVSHSSDRANKLLERIAAAAKKMPELKMLEIWHYGTWGAFARRHPKETGIFRYEKSDKSSSIVWYGTWDFYMSKQVEEAWHKVFTKSDDSLYEFDVKIINLARAEFTSLGSLYPLLKLKKHILDDYTWTQVNTTDNEILLFISEAAA
ncbi:hypothetical protein ACHAPT_011746 [Fusarium lateritium]